MARRWRLLGIPVVFVTGFLAGAALAGGHVELHMTSADLQNVAKVIASAGSGATALAGAFRLYRNQSRRRRQRRYDRERAEAEEARQAFHRARQERERRGE
jgi:hypothetical protein